MSKTISFVVTLSKILWLISMRRPSSWKLQKKKLSITPRRGTRQKEEFLSFGRIRLFSPPFSPSVLYRAFYRGAASFTVSIPTTGETRHNNLLYFRRFLFLCFSLLMQRADQIFDTGNALFEMLCTQESKGGQKRARKRQNAPRKRDKKRRTGGENILERGKEKCRNK